jgi:hypothetical protein
VRERSHNSNYSKEEGIDADDGAPCSQDLSSPAPTARGVRVPGKDKEASSPDRFQRRDDGATVSFPSVDYLDPNLLSVESLDPAP